jgi:hypothetical protein
MIVMTAIERLKDGLLFSTRVGSHAALRVGGDMGAMEFEKAQAQAQKRPS